MVWFVRQKSFKNNQKKTNKNILKTKHNAVQDIGGGGKVGGDQFVLVQNHHKNTRLTAISATCVAAE